MRLIALGAALDVFLAVYWLVHMLGAPPQPPFTPGPPIVAPPPPSR